jgi:hypothetical protein
MVCAIGAQGETNKSRNIVGTVEKSGLADHQSCLCFIALSQAGMGKGIKLDFGNRDWVTYLLLL